MMPRPADALQPAAGVAEAAAPSRPRFGNGAADRRTNKRLKRREHARFDPDGPDGQADRRPRGTRGRTGAIRVWRSPRSRSPAPARGPPPEKDGLPSLHLDHRPAGRPAAPAPMARPASRRRSRCRSRTWRPLPWAPPAAARSAADRCPSGVGSSRSSPVRLILEFHFDEQLEVDPEPIGERSRNDEPGLLRAPRETLLELPPGHRLRISRER